MARLEFFNEVLNGELRTYLIIGSAVLLGLIFLYFILTSGRIKAYFEQKKQHQLRERLREKLLSIEYQNSIKRNEGK